MPCVVVLLDDGPVCSENKQAGAILCQCLHHASLRKDAMLRFPGYQVTKEKPAPIA